MLCVKLTVLPSLEIIAWFSTRSLLSQCPLPNLSFQDVPKDNEGIGKAKDVMSSVISYGPNLRNIFSI
jgi:hypothetical protein